MCIQTNLNEKRILTFSALLASGFASAGLILGLIVGSLVIVFDGVYSLVSLLLSLLSLAVSRFIARPYSHYFPFGKAMLEPAVIAIKGSVILVVVFFSLYSAIVAMFSGGREINTGIATLFGALNVLACGYVWWHITKTSKHSSSGLIEAEIKQWKMDTLLSVAVTLGFIAAWLMTISPFSQYATYADPLMMILMSFYFIKVPLNMLTGALRELLMMKPDESICNAVDKEVFALDEEISQTLEVAAVTKVGRELRVNLDVHSKGAQVEVAELDNTRRALTDRLSKLPLDLTLTLNIAS